MVNRFEVIKIIADTQYNIIHKDDLERIKSYLFQRGFEVTMKEAETLWSMYSDIHGTNWLIADSPELYKFGEWLYNILNNTRC